ncbi:unnamed protein product [Protopolystoma xenopodis]|uniref:Secreted protein n=1 Tax=Protopolystoma xenopodis TaxID=117903 RepID=A0A448XNS5_9PLAT|nr:unnamed protein product [Protopolystoma xenopodis]
MCYVLIYLHVHVSVLLFGQTVSREAWQCIVAHRRSTEQTIARQLDAKDGLLSGLSTDLRPPSSDSFCRPQAPLLIASHDQFTASDILRCLL